MTYKDHIVFRICFLTLHDQPCVDAAAIHKTPVADDSSNSRQIRRSIISLVSGGGDPCEI
jgi:hypothetical protein